MTLSNIDFSASFVFMASNILFLLIYIDKLTPDNDNFLTSRSTWCKQQLKADHHKASPQTSTKRRLIYLINCWAQRIRVPRDKNKINRGVIVFVKFDNNNYPRTCLVVLVIRRCSSGCSGCITVTPHRKRPCGSCRTSRQGSNEYLDCTGHRAGPVHCKPGFRGLPQG